MRRLLLLKRIALFVVFLIFLLFVTHPTLWRDFGYITRPIWDKKPRGWNYINHYNNSCSAYNWTERSRPRRVIDATIFSIELDLLDLRMKELWDEVDLFVVVESNMTFTGHTKPMILKDNLKRFEWAKKKLRYHSISRTPIPEAKFFANEGDMRRSVEQFLVDEGVQEEDLVINSDIDEIPKHSVINLLRKCDGSPPVVHLAMPYFQYSFEFPQLYISDAPTVKLYRKDRGYTHGRRSDYLITGAGWHCTFCFPNIEDFQFKMQAYSHNDRLTDRKMLEPSYIKKKICNGKDLYGMFEEVYTYWEFLYYLSGVKHNHDYSNLPRGLFSDRKKFGYLLPGGREYCKTV